MNRKIASALAAVTVAVCAGAHGADHDAVFVSTLTRAEVIADLKKPLPGGNAGAATSARLKT